MATKKDDPGAADASATSPPVVQPPQPVFIVPPPPAPIPAGEVRKLDETPGGGRFIKDGVLINHDGQPINEDGTLKAPEGT